MDQHVSPARAPRHVSMGRTIALLTTLMALGGCQALQHQPPPLKTAHHSTQSERPDTQPPAAREEPTNRGGSQPPSVPAVRQQSAAVGTGDLWARIQAGLALDHATQEPRVQKELRWFAQHPEYLDRCAKRASLYLHHVVEEIEKRNMPLEVALLPVVESAFNPYAFSRSSAAGMWQFIGSTGRVYGLRQDWWYDGRRDVLESTRAALDYLEKLHKQFNDWPHALAAYNSGENRVARAIARNEALGKPTDFFSLKLPKETRAYVPKLLALSQLVAQPAAHGIQWLPIADRPYFDVIETGRPVALADIARLAGASEEEIYQLNPGFARWATPPEGPHRVLVPHASAAQVRASLDQLPEVQAVAWQQYKVQRGDTLSEIASRFSVSMTALHANNQLRGNLIKPGQTLSIPAPGMRSASGLQPANNPFIKPWHHGPSRSKARKRARTNYTVRRGDNLWNISRKYRVGVQELARWNGLHADSILQPGQRLRLYSVSSSAGRSSGGAGRKKVHYQVRGGDSLWAIARRFQVRVADLRNWNALHGSRHLKPGQNLTIFVD